MHGRYVSPRWDLAQLDILIRRLRESGIDPAVQWRRFGLRSTPDRANALRLAYDGRTFLVQRGVQGLVKPDRLPPAQSEHLLAVLHERGLPQPARYRLGLACAAVFALVYVLVLAPAFLRFGPVFMLVSAMTLAGTVSTLGLMAAAADGRPETIRTRWLLLLGLPGFLLHAPWSLLLAPIAWQAMGGWLTRVAHRAARRRETVGPATGSAIVDLASGPDQRL